MNKPTHLIIHHTAVSSTKDQFNAVNNYHQSLDFPVSSLGYYVGYHYFIERNGRVVKAREDSDEGAHTLGGWNKKSIGICLAGNFDVEIPTDAQLVACRGLIKRYKLPYLLHREADKRRTCPARYLTRDLLEILPKSDPEDLKKAKALILELEKENKALKITLKVLGDALINFFKRKK